MYTMREERLPGMVTQYFEAVIDTNYANLIILLNCADTMEKWLPMNKETKISHRVTAGRGLLY